jgi:hypothetical protein
MHVSSSATTADKSLSISISRMSRADDQWCRAARGRDAMILWGMVLRVYACLWRKALPEIAVLIDNPIR